MWTHLGRYVGTCERKHKRKKSEETPERDMLEETRSVKQKRTPEENGDKVQFWRKGRRKQRTHGKAHS